MGKLLGYDGLGIIDDWFLASDRRRGHVWQKVTRGIMGGDAGDQDRFNVVMPAARTALGRIAALLEGSPMRHATGGFAVGQAHDALI